MLVFLIVFVFLFVVHEIEEYFVLVPWVKVNRSRLPTFVQCLVMSEKQFIAIAVEELIVIILIGLVLDSVWLKATVVAYIVHLVIHCGQIVVIRIKGFELALWSAPIQLPLAVGLLILIPSAGQSDLITASLIMFVLMIANLILMHITIKKSCK